MFLYSEIGLFRTILGFTQSGTIKLCATIDTFHTISLVFFSYLVSSISQLNNENYIQRR